MLSTSPYLLGLSDEHVNVVRILSFMLKQQQFSGHWLLPHATFAVSPPTVALTGAISDHLQATCRPVFYPAAGRLACLSDAPLWAG